MKTTQATPRKRQSAGKASAGNSSTANGADTPPGIDLDQRVQMVARAAYFRAQRRGFAPGHELEDWLHAEAEIDDSIGRRMH